MYTCSQGAYTTLQLGINNSQQYIIYTIHTDQPRLYADKATLTCMVHVTQLVQWEISADANFHEIPPEASEEIFTVLICATKLVVGRYRLGSHHVKIPSRRYSFFLPATICICLIWFDAVGSPAVPLMHTLHTHHTHTVTNSGMVTTATR